MHMPFKQHPLHRSWLLTGSVAVLLALLLASVSFVRLGMAEFGVRADRPLAQDELYFMVCAARGLAVGEIPVSGCHDTKAPLIFLVHQFAQLLQPGYGYAAVKATAYGTVTLLVLLSAFVARRLGGWWAATAAAALVLQVFGFESRLAGLKTELVGSVFMLAGTWCLLLWLQVPTCARAVVAGLMYGLAIVSKQTFVFALLGPLAMLFWLTLKRQMAVPQVAAHVLGFLAASVVPAAAFLLAFSYQGRLPDFLGAMLLYPAAYTPTEAKPAVDVLLGKARDLVGYLVEAPFLVVLSGLAAWKVLWPRPESLDSQGDAAQARRRIRLGAAMVLFSAIGMLLLLLVAPVQFYYHLLPAWILMAVLAAWAVADVLSKAGVVTRFVVLVIWALGSALQTWQTWTVEVPRPPRDWNIPLVPELPGVRGQFAYVVGVWPAFYVVNGLIPASNVMYPSALPGSPAGWNYTPPHPDTLFGKRLLALQSNNARQLIDDFRSTPPRLVLVIDGDARAPLSTRSTDIDVVATYLSANCRPQARVSGTEREAGTLYACN